MSFERIFGVVALIIGLVDLVAYIAHFAGVKLPISFWKLKPMQDRWGKVPGTVLHFVSYVVVPIAVGVAVLMGYRL
ncbi:MAG: hypothetical protein ACE5LG_09165 [Anaerolineae bacterium]